tara:strand:+ start:794 stop:2425 length:1632 start_codon:yes stop_codon:yes gene_type:complete
MIRHDDIEQALLVYRDLVHGDPVLLGEQAASLPEFFGTTPDLEDPGAALSAAQRHLEWMVLERHSPSLLGTILEKRLDAWRRKVTVEAEDAEDLERALLESITGIFSVQEPQNGTMWVEDLGGFGAYPIRTEPGQPLLPAGDLIVGRLFPTDGGAYLISRAAGIFRGGTLLEALERDLAAIRNDGVTIVRVSQLELETMFFRAARTDTESVPATVAENPIQDTHDLLIAGGWTRERVNDLLARLKAAPFDPGRIAHGAGDVLGLMLDEIAFDTDVDLIVARTTLTHAWLFLAREGKVLGDAPRDPRAALAAFDQGRAAGRDLEALISDLEHDLGLSAAPGDEEPDTPAPDFPGVVGALVQEFVWDIGREDPQAAERYASLQHLSKFGAALGVVDELDASALLRFTAFWVPEQRALKDADEAHALIAALRAFCPWAQENHALPLHADFRERLEGLDANLPRIADVVKRVPAADEDAVGELYEVISPAPIAPVLADREGEHHAVRLEPPIGADLMIGDRLRGRRTGDRFEVLCVYPPEAAGLLGG